MSGEKSESAGAVFSGMPDPVSWAMASWIFSIQWFSSAPVSSFRWFQKRDTENQMQQRYPEASKTNEWQF